jgi:hypothetical protein
LKKKKTKQEEKGNKGRVNLTNEKCTSFSITETY